MIIIFAKVVKCRFSYPLFPLVFSFPYCSAQFTGAGGLLKKFFNFKECYA